MKIYFDIPPLRRYSRRMNAHKRAEKLCKEAESLGLCHPTESMIGDCLNDALDEQWQDIEMTLKPLFPNASDYLVRLKELKYSQQES